MTTLLRNGLLGVFFLFAALQAQAQDTFTCKSPDGRLEVLITASGSELTQSVSKDGTPVISTSALGLNLEDKDMLRRVKFAGEPTAVEVDDSYPVYGNHTTARDHCLEYEIPLTSAGVPEYTLVVRVYDDGYGIRYLIPNDGTIRVKNELTQWHIENDTRSFWADYILDYEALHNQTPYAEIPDGQLVSVPFTAKSNGKYIAISEADCLTFPDMIVRKNGNFLTSYFPSCPTGWTMQGDIVSPWRCVIIADDLTQLVNSDLILNLCPAPSADKNFDWAKPGRVLWQWWSSGSPEYADQKEWYDAAARLTWEYYLVDDGWRFWGTDEKDEWAHLKDVVDYGKSVGVESIIWVNSEEMRTRPEIRSYLEKVKAVGAVGIKIDFIPEATPEIIQWYQDALEETYDLQLMCNFHGCIKPSGQRRTWPHELTREAIRGHEFHISRYERVMPKDQDAIKPFTRLLAGPGDFTPTAFVPEELLGYTWPYELGQAIIYLSPHTHFADNYKYYIDSPVEDLLRDIPVVWDETIVLPLSEIGEAIGFVRRSGDEYWIAVLNGEPARQLELTYDFMQGNAYRAVVISNVDGKDDALNRDEITINKGDKVNLNLRSGGGYVVRLQPVK